MCQFKSFIVTKSGDILYKYSSDSHEDIIKKYNLIDNTNDPDKMLLARVEITPPDGNVFENDLSKWNFKIDQSIIPSWWSKKLEKKCFLVLEHYLSDVIITGEHEHIEDKHGLYIRDAKIKTIKNSRVNEMLENSQVNEMLENSQVKIYSSDAKYKLNDDAIAIDKTDGNIIIKVSNPKIKLKVMK